MFHFEIGRAADSWGFKSLGSGGECPPTGSILVIDETTIVVVSGEYACAAKAAKEAEAAAGPSFA